MEMKRIIFILFAHILICCGVASAQSIDNSIVTENIVRKVAQGVSTSPVLNAIMMRTIKFGRMSDYYAIVEDMSKNPNTHKDDVSRFLFMFVNANGELSANTLYSIGLNKEEVSSIINSWKKWNDEHHNDFDDLLVAMNDCNEHVRELSTIYPDLYEKLNSLSRDVFVKSFTDFYTNTSMDDYKRILDDIDWSVLFKIDNIMDSAEVSSQNTELMDALSSFLNTEIQQGKFKDDKTLYRSFNGQSLYSPLNGRLYVNYAILELPFTAKVFKDGTYKIIKGDTASIERYSQGINEIIKESIDSNPKIKEISESALVLLLCDRYVVYNGKKGINQMKNNDKPTVIKKYVEYIYPHYNYSPLSIEPVFPQGDFGEWINSHFVYPKKALEYGLQGEVSFSCVVDEFGNLTTVGDFDGEIPTLENEILRVLGKSPKWIPAKDADGNNCAVKFRYTKNFRIR